MTNQLSRPALRCPLSAGVYRLFCGERILHVGMAAGDATQSADHVDWEVVPDALFAYRRFLSVFASATYDASGAAPQAGDSPSSSCRHSQLALAP